MTNYNQEDLIPKHNGVAVLIFNKKGEVLVQDHVKYGFWTIPVGKCKQGESMEDGVRKEMFEETGLTVLKLEKIDEKVFKYDRLAVEVEVTLGLFRVIAYSGEMINKEPDKHRVQKFVPVKWLLSQQNVSDGTKMARAYLSSLG